MKRLLFVMALVVGVGITTASAQTIKRYKGPSDYGYIDYTYYVDKDGNRVRHGSYSSGEYKGRYSHGKKVGVWTMFESGPYYSMDNFRHVGTYKNGVLEGLYEIRQEKIARQSEVITRLYIKDSLMVGDIYYRTPDYRLFGNPPEIGSIIKGKTNERGKAHGIWTEKRIEDCISFGGPNYTRHDTYVYSREYFEGVLCKVSGYDEATGRRWVDYSLPEDFVAALKSSFDPKSNTFTYNGDLYQLIDYGVHTKATDEDEFDNYVMGKDDDDSSGKYLDAGSLEILKCKYASSLKLYTLSGYWGKGFSAMDGELYLKSPYSIFYNLDLYRRIEQEKIRIEQERIAREQRAKQHYDLMAPMVEKIKQNQYIIYSLYQNKENSYYIYRCIKDLYSSEWDMLNRWDRLKEESKIKLIERISVKMAKEFISYQELIIEILNGTPKEIKKLNKSIGKELKTQGYPEITIQSGKELLTKYRQN